MRGIAGRLAVAGRLVTRHIPARPLVPYGKGHDVGGRAEYIHAERNAALVAEEFVADPIRQPKQFARARESKMLVPFARQTRSLQRVARLSANAVAEPHIGHAAQRLVGRTRAAFEILLKILRQQQESIQSRFGTQKREARIGGFGAHGKPAVLDDDARCVGIIEIDVICIGVECRAQQAHRRDARLPVGQLDRHVFTRLADDARIAQQRDQITFDIAYGGNVPERRLDFEDFPIHRIKQVYGVETGEHRAQVEGPRSVLLAGESDETEISLAHEVGIRLPWPRQRGCEGAGAHDAFDAIALAGIGPLARIRADGRLFADAGDNRQKTALASAALLGIRHEIRETSRRNGQGSARFEDASVFIGVCDDPRSRKRRRIEFDQIERSPFGEHDAVFDQTEHMPVRLSRQNVESPSLRRRIQFERKRYRHMPPRRLIARNRLARCRLYGTAAQAAPADGQREARLGRGR